jgi:epoxyqueuosine reductase
LRSREDAALRDALQQAGQGADPLIAEHIAWALSAPVPPAALSSGPLSVGASE